MTIVLTVVAVSIVFTLVQNMLRSREKKQEVAQQEAANERAEQVANSLIASNERIADQASKAAVVLVEKLDTLHEQSEQIHVLVNSNLTAAMQSEYDSIGREIVGLLEIVDLKRAMHIEPSQESTHIIELTRAKHSELHNQLTDRAKQTEVANRVVEGS